MFNDWSIPTVFIWYSRRGDCNIPFLKKHCCSNVSMEKIESMALLIIRYLTHWSAWEDPPLIWKHKYYLPAGAIFLVVCKSIGAIVIVVFNGVKWVVMDVAWRLYIFLWCYKWGDVIYIWDVVLVLTGSNVFIIKLRRDRCSCQMTCRWCLRIWRW